MNNQNSVVVCGGGGFIGGHLVGDLLKKGYKKIRCVDVKPKSDWYQVHGEAENVVADLNDKQAAFDAVIMRAMSRRQFLSRLAGAAGAAVVLSGCGTVRGQLERQRLGAAAPVFDPVQREIVAKIIDGFVPPDSELRRRLA